MHILIAVFLIAIIFSLVMAQRGEKEVMGKSFLWFFLLFFFPLLTFSAWVPPIAPQWAGIAFYDLFAMALFITLVILAGTTPDYYLHRKKAMDNNDKNELKRWSRTMNGYYWSVIAFCIVLLILSFI